MHHLYPSGKGDPLCPLGFHPQVRWPTRCKRCFRDYKEHGGRKNIKDESLLSATTNLRRDDTTSSSPSLSSWNGDNGRRSWTSSPVPELSNSARDRSKDSGKDLQSSVLNSRPSSLHASHSKQDDNMTNFYLNRPASWTSTPDLGLLKDDSHAIIPTVSITLPRRRPTTASTTGTQSSSPLPPSTSTMTVTAPAPVPADTGQKNSNNSLHSADKKTSEKYSAKFNKNDSLATRVKKAKEFKDKGDRRIHVKELKAAVEEPTNHDVQFLIQVKSKGAATSGNGSSEDDTSSIAATETTDTTLVDPDRNDNELQEQIESLKHELETVRTRCEKAEREKSDILLRRLATYETTTSKTTASEVLKLQQRCNELLAQLEDAQDDKKSLNLRVKELEAELDNRPTNQEVQKTVDELRSKLLAAETLCEELMDENEDMKKEMRDLEEEMEEMQDNFREDQADEYTSLKKELEQTTKNCRILSFKLRKTERKVEQLEADKQETEKKLKDVSGGQSLLEKIEQIKRLEQELSVANEVAVRLQKELDEANAKVNKAAEVRTVKKKVASTTSNTLSPKEKISRESLTRGGSQDDPAQLLRDLQDCLEREADLREQLRFAEEEAQNLRKKASRVEDDNESLVMQLKKMATKARGRKLSPTPTSRLIPAETTFEKDEGISDDDDPAELRLLLELSEQETSVLRRKVEEMEQEAETMKRKLKDTQDKLAAKSVSQKTRTSSTIGTTTPKSVQDQKMKVLEEETSDLRKKLIEKERDCERLYAELSVTQKRSKGMQKSKSLDGDQQTLDLRRQLQVVEQEASVLQTKLQTIETDNEKLILENKRLLLRVSAKKTPAITVATPNDVDKANALQQELTDANKKMLELKENEEKMSSQIDELKQKISEIELDNTKLKETITHRQALSSSTLLKPRVPKKPTELTTKLQLKNMVLDLENEIGDMIVCLKCTEEAKSKLENEMKKVTTNNQIDTAKEKDMLKEVETAKNKTIEFEKKILEYKQNLDKEKNKNDELSNNMTKLKENAKIAETEKKQLQVETQKLSKQIEEIKSKSEKEKEKHQSVLSVKEKSIQSLEKNLETFHHVEQEKSNLAEQLSEKMKNIHTMEKQISEFEEKLKKNERLLSSRKERISKLDKEVESNKQQLKEKEAKWLEEKNTLEVQKKMIETEMKKMETELKQEKTVKDGDKSNTDEILKMKNELTEARCNLENMIRDKTVLEEKLNKLESELKQEKVTWENKTSDLESDLLMEKKKVERMKANQEKQQKNRELELNSLKEKIHSLETGSTLVPSLQQQLAERKQQYDDLTVKYEILEEEHVVTKAKLVMEKETIAAQLVAVQRDMDKIIETNGVDKDVWFKERTELQEQIRELNNKVEKTNMSYELDRTRMKCILEERNSELEQLKREDEVLQDQFTVLKKENDELKRKLDDFDKVSKIQRNISADSTALDKEVTQLKAKLLHTEKVRKTDLAECKMRYDSQVSIVTEQMQSLQAQVTRFKRERDTFKHMLEGAQRTLGELKSAAATAAKSQSGTGRDSRSSTHSVGSSGDEPEDGKLKLATLEQQVSCMEDELSEARLECAKLKTELVSERSSWEVKLSEMRSRINELEEDRLLSSGRTKVAGLRTRMELAWQKEREEQQRLLQETSTLARDLRQTLFEVERERDKERLEARRKQEQLKKTAEEEQEENRRKLNELQCDLLELRDAHAKLRTTNEKLRREKERNEKEREELRANISSKKRTDQEDDKRVNILLEQVETLLRMVPEAGSGNSRDNPTRATTPTPPRRTRGSKSRESSPGVVSRTSVEREIQMNVQRLKDAMQEVRHDRSRHKMASMRRAASTEQEPGPGGPTLNRRSLSLEHANVTDHGHAIWGIRGSSVTSAMSGDEDSLSSMQSLDNAGSESGRYYSMDSRLSGGSTKSEVIHSSTGDKKKSKKKGLMGKLKKLTKSRSIDDQYSGGSEQAWHAGGGSDTSSVGTDAGPDSGEHRGSKRDLKEKLAGMFKRGGSSSRSNSMERSSKTHESRDSSSLQRPLGSSVARPSPTPSETSITARRNLISNRYNKNK